MGSKSDRRGVLVRGVLLERWQGEYDVGKDGSLFGQAPESESQFCLDPCSVSAW